MNETIVEGVVVQLKSGGPQMTVISVAGRVVRCLWFSTGITEPVERDFYVNSLNAVPSVSK